ncbi:MAG: CheR family methyltransferase [Parvibaculaceae bacterium]
MAEDLNAEEKPVISGVVLVAAPESGLGSLSGLFSGLPNDGLDAAFIVAVPAYGGSAEKLRDVIAQTTGLTVSVVKQKDRLEPGTIHILPTDRISTLRKSRFAIEPKAGVHKGLVDSFLLSLASDQGDKGIGIILSGLNGDGTLGITALKEAGGLAVAELVDGVSPNAANPTGIVDYLLPAEEIAQRLASHLAHRGSEAGEADSFRPEPDEIRRIATILRNKTGHDFHNYKQNTFLRRIQRRMQVNQVDTVARYLEFLRGDGEEANLLFQDLLIGVTQFFRDTKEFELIENKVIPKLFEGKATGDHIRIWVLGCATGEEAYSIAILLREHMTRVDSVPHVQIFATDIDGRALAAARVGRFPESIARNVSPERLARWFIHEGNTYSVVKDLREMCIFSSHNLIKDAPFSRIDLISCRNLLIYLNADLQNRIIPLFHFSLRAGGYLFLGPSESVTRHAKLFSPVDRRHRIFQRQDTITRVLPEFPLSTRIERPDGVAEAHAKSKGRTVEPNIAKRAERMAERYVPAYIIVDDQNEVLHFSGRTGRYLEPATGSANLNLLSLVHRDLRLDLRAALLKAATERSAVRTDKILIGLNGNRLGVVIVIEPLLNSPGEPQAFVVFFQDAEITEDEQVNDNVNSSVMRDEHVQRIEAELRLTKERLQATIEELESTNEELKSSNEEYQSINEELQSANEELETSKEELQSVNEELQTVNGELAHRVHELARANSDLKNLLESTQIATIFLDNEFRVKSFTPAVAEIFHLIDSDVGRPIVHIAPRISYDDLQEDVRKVLRTLHTVEREVEDPASGTRYLVRVLPYRSVENFIAGVVLTFMNVTATARAEKALKESEERFRNIAQTVPAFLFIATPSLEWEYVNPPFYQYTGLSEGEALGSGWLSILHPDDAPEIRRRLVAASQNSSAIEWQFRLRGTNGTYQWFLGRVEAITSSDGRISRWFGGCINVNDRKNAEDRQQRLLVELQHRVKNILAVVRSLANRTAERSENLEEFVAHFDGRLSAMGRTQNILARTAEGGVNLAELVQEELLGHAAHYGEQVDVEGPEVKLRAKPAETLSLAIHELATNAVKYGALSTRTGHIRIFWHIDERAGNPRLALEWLETGVPVIDQEPQRSGFGRELIERGLPYELKATTALEFRQGGVRCVIELPLDDRTVFQERS